MVRSGFLCGIEPPSHFTVNVNCMDWLTLLAPVVDPLGEATALMVTVEVPVGVEKAAAPPQADIPARELITKAAAAHCIHNRRLARRLLLNP
jgi:hypothetical protein